MPQEYVRGKSKPRPIKSQSAIIDKEFIRFIVASSSLRLLKFVFVQNNYRVKGLKTRFC